MANKQQYSIPPILTDTALTGVQTPLPGPATGTYRVPLRKGIVCEVVMNRGWLLQNVEDNEDLKIEYSLHGEVDGTWNVMNAGSGIRVGTSLYFLNRTNRDVIYLAIFPQ